MDKVTAIDAIEKIVGLKVVDKIYDDLLSKPLQKVGTVFETIFDTANGFLEPLKFYSEKRRLITLINLKKLQAELENTPEDKLITVPPEIALPISDRLTYVSNEELSNAFIKLLTSASSMDTAHSAHPGFISILDRLSPDECKILVYINRYNHFIPRVDIKVTNNIDMRIRLLRNETGLKEKVELAFPNNIHIYMDNLISLGLTSPFDDFVETLREDYEQIEKFGLELLQKEALYDTRNQKQEIFKRAYLTTQFGMLFLNVCIGLPTPFANEGF